MTSPGCNSLSETGVPPRASAWLECGSDTPCWP
ncbi:Uncharacterised protein [Mycobacteroides abscessus subsp. abscessus]|nr:Uncharacterised protein [Mycobacteroides abscessus subsp. abscessus]